MVILAWGSVVNERMRLNTTRLHSFIGLQSFYFRKGEIIMNQACGTSNIAGASFTIAPMSDDFVDIILNSIKQVDTSKVWIETDDVSTTVRGKLTHVFDVTTAIFLHAASTKKHVSYQATYSLGCPGDSSGDVFMSEDNHVLNRNKVKSIKQKIAAKFSLYPLGGGDYMDTIYAQIEAVKEHVEVTPAHYSTRLHGDAIDVFDGLEKVFKATVEDGSSHTVMTVTVSANSPSHM